MYTKGLDQSSNSYDIYRSLLYLNVLIKNKSYEYNIIWIRLSDEKLGT